MFAAHVGDPEAWPWLVVADGRSSALFALMAGVSIALMLTHRLAVAPRREAVSHTRVRVAVRAVALIVLGWGVSALNTPVDVILDNLGVMFLLALPALGWRPRTQAAVGGALLAAGFWLVPWVLDMAVKASVVRTPVLHELWSHHYPALSWTGYVLIGLAVGGWAPWAARRRLLLGFVGLMLAGAAYGVGVASKLLDLGATPGQPTAGWAIAWTSIAPHSYTPFEMVGNVGAAFVVIALSLWIADRGAAHGWGRRALQPLAATGAMTLTLYTAHLVVISVVGREMVREPSNLALVVLCAGAVVSAALWQRLLGRGPLERLLTWLSTWVADAGWISRWRERTTR